VFLDPYRKCIARPVRRRREAARKPDDPATALKRVVVHPTLLTGKGYPYWSALAKTIICEMYVGGFTRHPSLDVAPAKPGTCTGLIGKIPDLRNLGVSAIELLPVFAFDDQDDPPHLSNYWGYNPRFSHCITHPAHDWTRTARSVNFAK